MRRAAEEEVNYITRESNIGFKAGNLRNAIERISGDFLVICDADTRPFPTILEHTLGYFRDPDVAWVQTPQWFFDLPEGQPLPSVLAKYLRRPGYWLGTLIERCIGAVIVGKDPFCNDPAMFYDILQRRRNWANAAFCSGAGSIHRREAVMEAALKTYAETVDGMIRWVTADVTSTEIKEDLSEAMRRELALESKS
jgi:cellulose synthase (UDP-forming)